MPVNQYVLGAFGGLVASLLMYSLLVPLKGNDILPPNRLAAHLLRRDERSPQARSIGFLLQVAFGLFWGLVMAGWNLRYFPVSGSYVAQGVLWGLAAFGFSFFAFAALGLLERPLAVQRWFGYMLTHLVFGACLGIFFLLAGVPATPAS